MIHQSNKQKVSSYLGKGKTLWLRSLKIKKYLQISTFNSRWRLKSPNFYLLGPKYDQLIVLRTGLRSTLTLKPQSWNQRFPISSVFQYQKLHSVSLLLAVPWVLSDLCPASHPSVTPHRKRQEFHERSIMTMITSMMQHQLILVRHIKGEFVTWTPLFPPLSNSYSRLRIQCFLRKGSFLFNFPFCI